MIDTDVLAHIRQRKDSAAIYAGLTVLAEQGTLRTVRQVFDELKQIATAYEAIKDHRQTYQLSAEEQHCSETQDIITILGDKADYLWEQTGGKNPDPADPWLIACGTVHGYTVVSDENPRSPRRIPAACKLVGCPSMRGPHFLYEVGIVKVIKPAHIDPEYFFEPGESEDKEDK